MPELFKTYLVSILIVAPIFIIAIRFIFKHSILARIGYTMVILAIVITLITVTFDHLNIPKPISIPLRFLTIISGILFIKRDIKILQTLSVNFKKLAEYSLDIQISENDLNRKDELGEVSQSIQKVAIQLTEIVAQIKESAKNVSHAGNELAELSLEVSNGADKQASSVENVVSSMDEMIATIDSNSEKAQITGKTAESSANEMRESNKIFMETVNAVSEISKKITLITDIAERTDMLSINASIEAARAGELGKGFGVVAQEIRKLADKTKTASDEINELSTNGQEISTKAGDKLSQIIPKINKNAEMVSNIVTASKEQQNSAESINESMQVLTYEIQNHTTSAAKMATAVEELSMQANELEKLIAVFDNNKQTPKHKL